jgi:hypothetical protein
MNILHRHLLSAMSKGLFIVDLVELNLSIEACKKIEKSIQEVVAKELLEVLPNGRLERPPGVERPFSPMGFFPADF